MSKANLYKYSNPHNSCNDDIIIKYGSFVDYYYMIVDGKINEENTAPIKKKKININNNRSDKLAFQSKVY